MKKKSIQESLGLLFGLLYYFTLILGLCGSIRILSFVPLISFVLGLGKIRSINSLASGKLFNLFNFLFLFNYLVSVSLFHLPGNFPSF